MPKALLDFLGYLFYFWSNEEGEPPHIHVSKGTPSSTSTKFRITKEGIELAHNDGQIPAHELKKSAVISCPTVRLSWRRGFRTLAFEQLPQKLTTVLTISKALRKGDLSVLYPIHPHHVSLCDSRCIGVFSNCGQR